MAQEFNARFSALVIRRGCYCSGMLFQALPSARQLYEALVARDPSYEGRAYVGVTSTGVFCRFTCSGRKPKFEHCKFFASIAECVAADFRACLRCRPLQPLSETHPAVGKLLAELAAHPNRRWTESHVSALGYDPSTIRRQFKMHLGVTFLDYARMHRIKTGAATLSRGEGVLEAQLDASFDSASGFRAAFARVLGRAPSDAVRASLLRADWIASPLGPLLAVTDAQAVHMLEFFDRKGLPTELHALEKAAKSEIGLGRFPVHERLAGELHLYFRGDLKTFNTPLAQRGSTFLRQVWNTLRSIPLGETRSYGDVADALGRPTAARAVARANGANQIGILVPCHRVIGYDGELTGYGGGLWRKRWLLDHEQRVALSYKTEASASSPSSTSSSNAQSRRTI